MVLLKELDSIKIAIDNKTYRVHICNIRLNQKNV